MSKTLTTLATKNDLMNLQRDLTNLKERVDGHDEDIKSLRDLLAALKTSGSGNQATGATANDIILLRTRVRIVFYFVGNFELIQSYL